MDIISELKKKIKVFRCFYYQNYIPLFPLIKFYFSYHLRGGVKVEKKELPKSSFSRNDKKNKTNYEPRRSSAFSWDQLL